MASSLSLAYYERVFGCGTPAYDEVRLALAHELRDYATAFAHAWDQHDSVTLTRLRHDHRPAVENLALRALQDLEREAQSGGSPDLSLRFAAEVDAVVSALTAGLSPSGPAPQEPSRGD